MSTTIGELIETLGQLKVEWRIPDFFSLPGEIDVCYTSTLFYFSGASWYLKIFPNGQSKFNSKHYVGLFLVRANSGPWVSMTYTLALKTAKGLEEGTVTRSNVFKEEGDGYGRPEYLSRSVLQDRKPELAPSDAMTFTCCLKHDDPNVVAISTFNRLQGISTSLKNVLKEKKRTDIVLKVKEKEFLAHRMILESRSSVFAAMFSQDMEETRTGVVNISDIEPDVFECVLSYAYSGEIEGMTSVNVLGIYAAADKYDFQELKHLCTAFMEENLSLDGVCDVIKFADLYEEEGIERRAKRYFRENLKEILETEHWKTFAKENHEYSMDLITTEFKEYLSGRGTLPVQEPSLPPTIMRESV